MDENALIETAIRARHRAYAPYSDVQVGAALAAADQIIAGCNVENTSLGLTICAERVAACTAVASGRRHWDAIVVASDQGFSPCGACRQFLAEFAPQLPVIIVKVTDERVDRISRLPLDDLLPASFRWQP